MSVPPPQVTIGGRPGDGTGWPLDRGLHYGDGLFETLVVRNGRARFLELHRARLARGLHRLRIGVDEDALWREVDDAAARHAQGTLKLLVTRGDATERGYGPSGNEQPRRMLLAYPPVALPVAAGEGAISLSTTLGENPLLAGLKHANRLEQVLARMELATTGAFEGLMCSSSGLLVSGTISNVYVRLQGQWQTPRIERCGIAGVMRAVVLREAPRTGLVLREADIRFTDLAGCEALCISNVRLGLRPLATLDGRALAIDAAVASLARHVETLDE